MFWQLNPKERLGYGILAVLVLAILGVLGYRSSAGPAMAQAAYSTRRDTLKVEPKREAEEMMVHVVGAVRHPGVYRLPNGDRAQDALAAAGGATAKADTESVNLAAKLVDGEQLRIPERGEEDSHAKPVAGAKAQKITSGAVSLNTGSADELTEVPGIGPATAQKIIAYRETHGGFTSIEQLRDVGGIGDKKLARMEKFLKL